MSKGPPPASSIFSEMKFHEALKPVHTRTTAARNPQNLGASWKTAPTAPSRPCPSSLVGRSRSIVKLHASAIIEATA